MHYWRKNNALQTLGVPWPAAAGPPGPVGHYFFTNNALAGILIIIFLSLRLDFKIWLNEAHFSHDDPYSFDDYKRTMHHRIMKRIAQESLGSPETVHAIFLNIG